MPGLPRRAARRGQPRIPLAPGPSNLEAMSWAWLNSPAVVLVGFIAMLIGIPPSVAFIVQFVRPVIRHVMSRRAKKPAALPAPTVLMEEVSPSAGRPSPADVPCRSVASYMAASSPLRTITWKSVPDLYETGLSQPTPWDGRAKGGVVVYPGGL